MLLEAKIQKWGNGLGLRVSGVLRDIPQFTVDTPVEINVTPLGFTVVKKLQSNNTMPFSEADLLQGMTADNAHADCLAVALDTEWVAV